MKAILLVFLLFTLVRRNHGARESRVADVILKFYTGSTTAEFVDVFLPDAVSLLDNPAFNPSAPTILYSHGFVGYPHSVTTQTVLSAYLQTYPGYNIICVDWSNMSSGDYFTAASNSKLLGEALASELKNLIQGGLDAQTIELVGHSLGGQALGFTAKFIQGFNIKLKRIVALDPANPGFYPGVVLGHISASDAECVVVLHTDAGITGAPVHTGTVDFWVNGGKSLQPGCLSPAPLQPFLGCSHERAVSYWAEAILNNTAFPAALSSSYTQFKLEGNSTNIIINYMGSNTVCTTPGDYYLRTNRASLFGKGMSGIV